MTGSWPMASAPSKLPALQLRVGSTFTPLVQSTMAGVPASASQEEGESSAMILRESSVRNARAPSVRSEGPCRL